MAPTDPFADAPAAPDPFAAPPAPVLLGSGDRAQAYWGFATADLAAAVAALDCAP